VKSEEVRTRWSNLAESSKEDYGLERGVLPVMSLLMMMQPAKTPGTESNACLI
jgi:hypothetical protein